MPLQPGERLGPYEILAPIGAGGMGEVYRASDTRLGRDVALKILPAKMSADPDRLARFRREARAVAALNHPNVVTLYSVEQIDGIHFITMELVDGDPLEKLIPVEGFAPDRVIEMALGLAEAIAAAHDKGLVHRDLKPTNIMITRDGRVKVLDFGLAKEMRAVGPKDETVTSFDQTQAGMVMGTPPYMSPEQISGAAVDHRTDIFSLGIILYEMVTGRRPFQGKTQVELAASILRDTPLAVTKAEVPSALVKLIEQCLAKDAGERMQTARLLAEGLRSARIEPAPMSVPRSTGGDEGFWVAVEPFKFTGTSAELSALAEGLTEEIVAGLSRFSYLLVLTKGSAGARYILEGSLRRGGAQLRVSVQLIDKSTGGHLWAETYTLAYSPESVFEIQDEMVPRIVSTCADMYGVLTRSISEAIRGTDPARWRPYEALMRFFGYHQRLTSADHLEARHGLEHAVEIAPRNADCWAALAWVYGHEYAHGFDPRPGSLDRALAAAQRAVDLEPSNHLAHQALSVALFFRRETAACLAEADRAIELNPLDGGSNANMGAHIAFCGDWDRGCALIEHARRINPQHPAWYGLMIGLKHYIEQNYQAAVGVFVRASTPGFFWTPLMLAAAYGQLDQPAPAQKALAEMQAMRPDLVSPVSVRDQLNKWFLVEDTEHILEGLSKAGLIKAGLSRNAGPAAGPAALSIAVLPFANLSADKEQEYFSDGLAEEIINLLAQVAGLRVIARTSSFAFRGKEEDVRKIAETLNVTHILEGSVRRAGNRIRVTAQLIAAADGVHLWSERYDRELSDIFAVQDEMSAAITGALRVKLSGESAPQRYMPKMPAYEAYLKAKYLQAAVTPESLELARRCYESAIELDPMFALAHVGLGYYWLGFTIFGRCPAHEAVPSARAEVQRALLIDPSLPEAHALLGYLAALYDLDWAAAELHFSSPLSKQVGFSLIRPIYGAFQFLRGNVEQAIELAQRAIEEDPLEVWPRMNLHAYLQAAGRDDEAFQQLRRVLELDETQVVARVSIAMIHADRGELPEALHAARRAYAIGPWLPDTIGVLAGLLRRNGQEDESQELVRSLGSGEAPGDARAHALFHLLTGEVDRGADWAEKAIEQRDNSMMYYLRFVVCKKLRASHRWQKIAEMVNLPVGRLASDVNRR